MLLNVVTIICLVGLIAELIGITIGIITKKRADRIAFIRGFKKGKCAIIYVIAIPLYCAGHMEAGQEFLKAFFTAVNKIINLVVLKYDIGSIETVMNSNQLYKFTIYFCFVLVGFNALFFTFSLISQHVWVGIQNFKASVTLKDKLYIFGNNEKNIQIYKSDKKRSCTIVDKIDDKESEKLYMKKVSYINTTSYQGVIKKLIKRIIKSKRSYTVIVNTLCDETNMKISRHIINALNQLDKDEIETVFLRLRVFVFGDPIYEAVYEDISSSSYGCIQYENKYQRIAMDFIDRYPISSFLREEHLEKEEDEGKEKYSGLIKREVNINVVQIGFGRTNRQIFLTSVANNQFLQRKASGKGVELKPVSYYIFDKSNAENDKNLNHSYKRYENEIDIEKERESGKYLPLPPNPAEIKYSVLDVNDKAFYTKIRTAIEKPSKQNEEAAKMENGEHKNVTFLIISFGTDLENIDLAQKLVEKRNEWGLDNLIIFVKARGWKKTETLIDEQNCFFIGNEAEVVYDIEKIVNGKITKMAKMRNEVYDLESKITSDKSFIPSKENEEEVKEESLKRWHKMDRLQRESNLYCCLSLRSKLNLMGLDYKEIVTDSYEERGRLLNEMRADFDVVNKDKGLSLLEKLCLKHKIKQKYFENEAFWSIKCEEQITDLEKQMLIDLINGKINAIRLRKALKIKSKARTALKKTKAHEEVKYLLKTGKIADEKIVKEALDTEKLLLPVRTVIEKRIQERKDKIKITSALSELEGTSLTFEMKQEIKKILEKGKKNKELISLLEQDMLSIENIAAIKSRIIKYEKPLCLFERCKIKKALKRGFYERNEGYYILKLLDGSIENSEKKKLLISLEKEKALSEQDYLDLYVTKGDAPDIKSYNRTVNGKKIVYYDIDFNEDSLRTTFAKHEHERWNSFMISKGMIPSTIEQIKSEKNSEGKYTNGKNYSVRRHGNLTTFEGLVDFRKIVAMRDGKEEKDTDVIKYDYQILDDAFWLLEKNNFKLIKRWNNN